MLLCNQRERGRDNDDSVVSADLGSKRQFLRLRVRGSYWNLSRNRIKREEGERGNRRKHKNGRGPVHREINLPVKVRQKGQKLDWFTGLKNGETTISISLFWFISLVLSTTLILLPTTHCLHTWRHSCSGETDYVLHAQQCVDHNKFQGEERRKGKGPPSRCCPAFRRSGMYHGFLPCCLDPLSFFKPPTIFFQALFFLSSFV